MVEGMDGNNEQTYVALCACKDAQYCEYEEHKLVQFAAYLSSQANPKKGVEYCLW